jgi:hypothetical protein
MYDRVPPLTVHVTSPGLPSVEVTVALNVLGSPPLSTVGLVGSIVMFISLLVGCPQDGRISITKIITAENSKPNRFNINAS